MLLLVNLDINTVICPCQSFSYNIQSINILFLLIFIYQLYKNSNVMFSFCKNMIFLDLIYHEKYKKN